MMSGARKCCSCSATKGRRYVYIVITLLILIGCFAKKITIDCEEVKVIGYHRKDDPRCVTLKTVKLFERSLCEDKILFDRYVFALGQRYVSYKMLCLGETDGDPYDYLSMILSTNITSVSSDKFPNGAYLHVSNCSAPSSNQSVLFEGGSTGFVGGWRQLPLTKLTIECKHEKTRHFSMHYWSGLKQLETLNIACPKLSNVDEDLFSEISKRLKYLQFTDTEIQHFPERFFSNKEVIETLDLQRNKLRSFKRSYLSSMRNLKRLYLSKNEIEILDDDIFLQTENLTDLDLERNSLTALPTSVCSLRNLEILNAAYNRISFIPKDCLRSLPSLLRIHLNGNTLLTFGLASESILPNYNKVLSFDETLPNSSSTLEQSSKLNNAWTGSPLVRNLRLHNNSLSSLPDEAFYGMVRLRILSISSNNISHLPENIFSRNKDLRQLLASNNLFTHIPASLLRNNYELRKLDLSHNFIETLHEDFFSNTTELCRIDISENRIRRLPDKIFQPFKAQDIRCDEFFLDMSRNRLEDVPELSIPELTHLNLSENYLTLIKLEILSQAPHLLEVNLSHNLIHTIEIPSKIQYYFPIKDWDLAKLKVIDLSSNQLTKFQSIQYFVPNLKHLNISSNNITNIQFILYQIQGIIAVTLETFDMSRNSLKSVDFNWPEDMKYLDLSHNDIDLEECREYVDPVRIVWGCFSPLHRFSALEVIILSHNQIAFIPMEFQHYLPKLRFVDLSHNKIKQLWHGDLLYTRARDNMDLELFRTNYEEEYSQYLFLNDAFKNRFPGSKNLTIDLRHNSISSLQLPDDKIGVVIPGCDIGSKFSRVKLLLGHNPFVCDCEVFKLLRYASKEMRPTSALERLNGHKLVMPAVIDIQDLHCSEPDSMKGKAIADVESWAYQWLPMIGLCLNHLEVQSKLGKTSAKPAKVEAMDEPPT